MAKVPPETPPRPRKATRRLAQAPHPPHALHASEYEKLGAFRCALRSFLRFSEDATATLGLTAQHYQALLVLRVAPQHAYATINALADRLLIRHNSAVGLCDRLVKQGLVRRERSAIDRREVHLVLTPRGEHALERLASVHRAELRRAGPHLAQLLVAFAPAPETVTVKRRSTRRIRARAMHDD